MENKKNMGHNFKEFHSTCTFHERIEQEDFYLFFYKTSNELFGSSDAVTIYLTVTMNRPITVRCITIGACLPAALFKTKAAG